MRLWPEVVAVRNITSKKNIEETVLFTINSEHPDHMAEFCESLSHITVGDAMARAVTAINETERMICAGPDATPLGSVACALITFRSFLTRYSKPGVRPPSGIDFDPVVWDEFDNPAEYKRTIDKTKAYKANIPNRFWAAFSDVEHLESTESVDRFRLKQFLGLDDSGEPTILIGIEDGKEPHFFIPTGWDGFTNRHFLENVDYDPADPSTHFGYTRDLASAGTDARGAREVVSKPVSTEHTNLIRKYL